MTESAEKQQQEAPIPSNGTAGGLASAIHDLHRVTAGLLSQPAAYVPWPERLQALAQRLQVLRKQSPDALMYLLFQAAGRMQDRYSSHHALVCATLTAECAQQMAWPEVEIHTLMLAALSMNLSITALQDELVHRERTPTLDQRTAIDQHARASAEMLGAIGVTDSLWLGVVAQHHQKPTPEQREQGLDAPQRLAELLHRVDIYSAKLSPRRARRGQLPTMAVRGAYLGGGNKPDAIGIALTKAVGIFPLASFVTLCTGETAIVLKRGARPSQPWVASLIGPDKQALAEPKLRDSSDPGFAIRAPAQADSVRLAFDHERLLELIPPDPA